MTRVYSRKTLWRGLRGEYPVHEAGQTGSFQKFGKTFSGSGTFIIIFEEL